MGVNNAMDKPALQAEANSILGEVVSKHRCHTSTAVRTVSGCGCYSTMVNHQGVTASRSPNKLAHVCVCVHPKESRSMRDETFQANISTSF